jgi:hypothetical protein
MRGRWMFATLRNHPITIGLLLLGSVTACHTPAGDALFLNQSAGTCNVNGCAFLLTGTLPGSTTGPHQGAGHAFSVNVNANQIGDTGSIGSGAWVVNVQGSCVATTNLNINIPAGPSKFCVFCGNNPPACNFADGAAAIPIQLEPAR